MFFFVLVLYSVLWLRSLSITRQSSCQLPRGDAFKRACFLRSVAVPVIRFCVSRVRRSNSFFDPFVSCCSWCSWLRVTAMMGEGGGGSASLSGQFCPCSLLSSDSEIVIKDKSFFFPACLQPVSPPLGWCKKVASEMDFGTIQVISRRIKALLTSERGLQMSSFLSRWRRRRESVSAQHHRRG